MESGWSPEEDYRAVSADEMEAVSAEDMEVELEEISAEEEKTPPDAAPGKEEESEW